MPARPLSAVLFRICKAPPRGLAAHPPQPPRRLCESRSGSRSRTPRRLVPPLPPVPLARSPSTDPPGRARRRSSSHVTDLRGHDRKGGRGRTLDPPTTPGPAAARAHLVRVGLVALHNVDAHNLPSCAQPNYKYSWRLGEIGGRVCGSKKVKLVGSSMKRLGVA